MHAQWADDVHHALHVALTGETQGYYADFADPGALAKVLRTPFFHDGTCSTFRGRTARPARSTPATVPGWRFVASLQTHDQVGNRAQGDRLSGRCSLDPGVLACGAAILLTSPWTPMLFMGEEWGASTPWQFFTDHTDPELARPPATGRKAEFGSHGWDRERRARPAGPRDVPALAAGLVRAAAGAARAAAGLVPRPDRPAPPRAGAARRASGRGRRGARRGVRRPGDDPGRYRTVVNLADAERSVPLDGADAAAYPVLLAWEPEGTSVRDGALMLPAPRLRCSDPATA